MKTLILQEGGILSNVLKIPVSGVGWHYSGSALALQQGDS